MMKATGLKRGSRKKQQPQQDVMDNDDPVQRSVLAVKQPQPPMQQNQPVQQPQSLEKVQPRRRPNDEVAALTTKNYRLAKELADLRVRHRDECKNVTRLTMENMNLASRCREAISHVAMLKKELAMQQKRTAAALASHREQNQRMADSLTNSMELSRRSRTSSEASGDAKDENLARLVTATPSPLRANLKECLSPTSSKTTIFARPPSPPEEARDSPPTDLAPSPLVSSRGSSSDEDEDVIAQVSTVSNSPTESYKDAGKSTSTSDEEPGPNVQATPKRGGKWAPNLKGPSVRGGDDEGGLFPPSASPQVFSGKQKSYNEEFPGDIQNGKDDGSGAFPSSAPQQRKINLLNSIDAFEQSFSVDFPDSFTHKDINADLEVKTRKIDIYNPFFSTPERFSGRSKIERDLFRDEEEKKTNEPSRPFESAYKASNFETPPRVPRVNVGVSAGEPPRPEKSENSAARERYERALQPRQGTATTDKTSKSNSPSALLRRNTNNNSNNPFSDAGESIKVQKERSDSVVDIVDAFEGCMDTAEETSEKSNRRLSTRRNVKQPISYAEPPLNTKLRRGDTFFPKLEEEQKPQLVAPRAVSP
ncbi:shugoshin related kinetochore-attachment protein [Nitzschia inconspicua]|uniref:Shugoshin related kinetochore-attachment protein n=1 Tax=Nitzschia inconspicua TaxID=303405 RepID=A0A9K3K6Y7_9STRA|nr:shugoshin related kinetochore-attachment protein [Nitzschia inconspicua]KAG7348261.1 shugoshin related kinetochore-attachment protein [Nitzschia inconspicua]